MKRGKSEMVEEGHENGATPKKTQSRRAGSMIGNEPEDDIEVSDNGTLETISAAVTPSTSARGRRKKNAINTDTNGTPMKNSSTKKLFSTPIKVNGIAETSNTPTIARNVNRSARRKSTR